MLETIGESEIGNDNIAIAVQKKVFKLEVAVNNFALMDVPYTGNELGEKAASVFFFEEAMGENMIEQFTARGVVEDDADVFIGLNNVV